MRFKRYNCQQKTNNDNLGVSDDLHHHHQRPFVSSFAQYGRKTNKMICLVPSSSLLMMILMMMLTTNSNSSRNYYCYSFVPVNTGVGRSKEHQKQQQQQQQGRIVRRQQSDTIKVSAINYVGDSIIETLVATTSSSSLTIADTVSATSSTASTTSTSFEPVLNVPQLGAFVFIASIFVMLQLRIQSIEQAAERRTIALNNLRIIKTQSLTSPVLVSSSSLSNSTDTSTSTIITNTKLITNDDVVNAIEEYRKRYEEVEQLREIIPGIRIVQPPSQVMTRQRIDDNIAGAQQFLGIVPESTTTTISTQQQSKMATTNNGSNKATLDDKNESGNDTPGLTILQQVALAFILVTQCSLFCLLLIDPMSKTDPFF